MKNITEQKIVPTSEEAEYEEMVTLVESLAAWVTFWERNIELYSGKERLEVLRMRAGSMISDIRKSQTSEEDLFAQLIEKYMLDEQP
ncbi:MAG: hypothetical protein AAFW00_17745 [Bacteroidota bacterium]